jgi:hypothetical protein
MSGTRTPNLRFKYTDANGFPLAAGKVYTYAAGSTVPAVTYVDAAQTAQNTNPVILDAAGEAKIFLNFGDGYKFVVKDLNDFTIATEDNVYGVVSGSNLAEITALIGSTGTVVTPPTGGGTTTIVNNGFWVTLAAPPTWTGSGTSIQVTGDQTTTLAPGTRFKFTTASATGYGTVLTSAFTSPNTTITVTQDGIPFDNTATSIAYSSISVTNPPLDAAAVRYTPSFTYTDPNTVGFQLNKTSTKNVVIQNAYLVPPTTTGSTASTLRLLVTGPCLVSQNGGKMYLAFQGSIQLDVLLGGTYGVIAPYMNYTADITATLQVFKDVTGNITNQLISRRSTAVFGGRSNNVLNLAVSGVFDPGTIGDGLSTITGYRETLLINIDFYNTSTSVPGNAGSVIAGSPAPVFAQNVLNGQFVLLEL